MGARQRAEKRAALPISGSAARRPRYIFLRLRITAKRIFGPLQFAPAPRTKYGMWVYLRAALGAVDSRLCIVCRGGCRRRLQRRDILFDSRDGLYVALHQRRVFLAVFVQRIHQSAKLALGAAQLVLQRKQVHLLFSLLGQVSCCLYGRVRQRGGCALKFIERGHFQHLSYFTCFT